MSSAGREEAVILSAGEGVRPGSDEPGPEAPWRAADGLFSGLRSTPCWILGNFALLSGLRFPELLDGSAVCNRPSVR